MLWQELTWPDIAALDKDMPVVIPLGSIEQHGHHLPVCVDTVQVTEIARRTEQRLADKILLLPTQWLGSSHHHNDFPGVISVSPSLYSQMIKEIAVCVINSGFKRIFFLNGHGGNRVPGAQALSELVVENDEADAVFLTMATWWHIGADALDAKKRGMATPNLTHACEYETSMMLFLRNDLVHMDRCKDTSSPFVTPWFNTEEPGRPVQVFSRFARRTSYGSMGSGSKATAKKGEEMTAGVVDHIVAFLEDFRTWPRLEKIGPK
jgi:creatinine amidohydrolase